MIWTADDIPDQRGRVAVVTGANVGLGFESAAALARRGAQVVLAVRNVDKGKEAADRIRSAEGPVEVSVVELDLTSLDSVRSAACELNETHARIDIVINNAGIMWTPEGHTKDGFELQFGTNHLGHFALTGLVLPKLLATPGSRIVTVSSLAHGQPTDLDLNDLANPRSYDARAAYTHSKLANLMFTYELQRRLEANKTSVMAVAAHPGLAKTELGRSFPADSPFSFTDLQPAAMGALPILRAAVAADVAGGQYWGPDQPSQWAGYPTLVQSSRRSHDPVLQQQLWELSEKLTGVSYRF